MRSIRSFRGVVLVLAGIVLSSCSTPTEALVTPHSLPMWSARVSSSTRVRKIDLLFMIDNSSSMADKQEILALAVPDLVGRLVNPVCVDSTTFQQVGTQGRRIVRDG